MMTRRPLFRHTALTLLLCLIALASCRTRPVARPPKPDVRYRERLDLGNAALARHHLYGWRHAETEFARAYELNRAPEILQRLLLSRFLILTRSVDEDIPCPAQNDIVEALCAAAPGAQLQPLCELARQYQQGFGALLVKKRTESAAGRAAPSFRMGDAALDAYLGELYRRTNGLPEPPKEESTPLAEFQDSPLFIYLDMSRRTTLSVIDIEKANPEFAELFAFAAADLFQQRRYNAARAYFKKALGLLPDYTRALTGMGNVHLFALEDWEKALEYYREALRWDPSNSAALFGQGCCLHHMEMYAESNASMEEALRSDLTRRGRSGQESVRYFQTEANYYIGYNRHLMKDNSGARRAVDAALQAVGYSEHVDYLSGLIYFNEGLIAEAEREFRLLIQRGTSLCNAKYYLGRILHGRRNPEAADYFLTTCSCMNAGVKSLERQIQQVAGMEVTPAEKVVLKGKLENKLLTYRRESAAQIQAMIQMVAGSDYPKKDFLAEMMSDVRSRIAP